MLSRLNFKTHLLSPRLGVYALLLTPLVSWSTLFFGYASAKTFWIFAVVELTLIAYLWMIYWRPSLRSKWNWQTGVLVGFLIILTLSTIFGVSLSNSFWGGLERNEGLLMWLHLAVIFPVLLSLFRTEKSWLSVAVACCGVGLVVSVIFILMRLSIYVPSVSDNGGSTLGNSSYLGGYLLFQMFFAGLLVLRAKTRWMQVFGVFSFAVFVLTLALTDARAATIAFFGGAILYGALRLAMGAGQKFKRVFGWTVIALMVVGFAFVLASALRTNGSVHQFIVEQTTGSRFIVGRIAWKAFLDRPFFGWGPENFDVAFLKYYDPCFGNKYCGGNTLFDRAHNIVFDMLVHTGLLGLIGYLAILASVVLGAWFAAFRHGYDKRVAALLTSLMAAYFVQNLTFFDTMVTLLFLVLIFTLSTAMSSPDFLQDELAFVKETPTLPLLPVLGTALFPFLFFFFVVQPIRAGLAVFPATRAGDSVERFSSLEITLDTSSIGMDVRRAFLGYSTADLLWSFHPETDKEKLSPMAGYLQKEAAAIEAALFDTVRRSPNDLRAYLYLTRLLHAHARLFDARKFVEAFAVVDEAIERTPKSPRLRWVKTSLLLEMGKIDEAREAASIALELNNDAGRSQFNKFLFATYVGDVQMQKEAIAALEASHPKFVGLIPEVLGYDREVRKYAFFNDLYSE